MPQKTPEFILIDDDVTNNMICRKYIELLFPGADIALFTDPLPGLEYIRSTYEQRNAENVYLFLDVNTPEADAWEVLEEFAQFPESIRQQFTIYIFSSSISHDDKKLAAANPLISGYIEKPLSLQKLQALFPYAGS